MENKEEKDQKVLMVRLPLEVHSEAKSMAAKKNITLSTYVRRALHVAIKTDKDRGL